MYKNNSQPLDFMRFVWYTQNNKSVQLKRTNKMYIMKGELNMLYYGYVRVSTKKQSEKMQLDEIHKFSRIDKMFSEGAFTGTTTNRDKFQKLVEQVNEDIENNKQVTIIFYSVSRMSRNAEEGLKQYFEWYNKGVELVFLKEHHIDTASYRQAQCKAIEKIDTGDTKANKLVNDILDCLNEFINSKVKDDIVKAFEQAQKEVQDLHERTKDGMKASGAADKIRQARKGQTYTTLKELETRVSMLQCLKEYGSQQNIAKFAKDRGLSRVTVYKYRDAINADLQTMTAEQAIKQYTKLIKDKEKTAE